MRRAIFNIIGMALIAFGGMYLTTSPAMAAEEDVCGQAGIDSCEEMMDCCDGSVCVILPPDPGHGSESWETGTCM